MLEQARSLSVSPLRKTHILLLALFSASISTLGQTSRPTAMPTPARRIELHEYWRLESACKATDAGEKISLPGYDAHGWLVTQVPATVLAAQVNNSLFQDPFFAINLRDIPGTDYPMGKIYGYLPMTESSPYRCSWWYRTEFIAPFSAKDTTWLHFNGINYRANIWINGNQIARADETVGAYRTHEFDVSKYLIVGNKNALAVEVFAQGQNDLGIDFLDWAPAPADKNLGLWRNVYLARSGPVALRDLAVTTHFADDNLSAADLTVLADVLNNSDSPVRGTLTASFGAAHFKQPMELAAREKKVIHLAPDKFQQLHVKNPKVWWPYQYGAPNLQSIRLAFVVNRTESDAQSIRFGIREVQSDLNDKGYRQFRINRRNILVRGAGWTPDLFYREPHSRLQQELAYVRHMNLNTIRLEGKLGSDDLFDLADEMGILIMAGWQCCDFWQQWPKWTPQDHEIAAASTYSQISRLRSHPSILVWLNGSDESPAEDVEKAFIDILKERDWPNPVLSAAADRKSSLTGKTGVKMSGPYDYVPPEYWYLDTEKFGGAFGFNTETSPGPAIPSANDVQRTLAQKSWWPMDEQWSFHAGLGKFAQYNIFTAAMNATYGEAKDLDDYSRKAQLMAYDGERAMFEAYGANKYTSTGVIQWMLNNAWPSFIWHLYDYYLSPGGGYFGTRKANEPLHVQYRYDDRRVSVVNSSLTARRGLRVVGKVVDLSGKQQFSREGAVDVRADGVVSAFTIPPQTATTFLKLELFDSRGNLISENFYWIPAKLAQLEWDKSTYYYTPAVAYADMRDLAQLPQGAVEATARAGTSGEALVRLKNVGSSVAFFVHLRAAKSGTDEELTPVLWDDNFISLLPGEARVLAVRIPSSEVTEAEIELDGWNVKPQTLRIAKTSPSARSPGH